MDWKIELLAVPVSDIDRAKEFYVDRIGFVADVDVTVDENPRVVQLTPPGSPRSIVRHRTLTTMAPGSLQGIQIVVPDADEALAPLRAGGIEARGVEDQPW